jgi:hypothetical protein
MGKENQTSISLRILKWFGHIIGGLASAFFIVFFFGEGIPGLINNGIATELLLFMVLLFIAIAGWVVSLFEARIGGILQIIGGCAMSIYHLANGGLKDLDMAIVFGMPFILCGLISLIYHSVNKINGAII